MLVTDNDSRFVKYAISEFSPWNAPGAPYPMNYELLNRWPCPNLAKAKISTELRLIVIRRALSTITI